MPAGVSWYDPGTLLGLTGPFAIVIGAIALGWAINRARVADAWKQASDAAHEGWTVCRGRLEDANKWGQEMNLRRQAAEAVASEKDIQIAHLTERLRVQDNRVESLLERTPEALWQAVEKHAAEAEKHWAFERRMLEGLEAIGEDVRQVLHISRSEK